jgi:Na+/H+ antiporter NhaD/arsenite permease-like protein
MIFSAVLSALTGEVTSIIVMMAIILDISDSLKIHPVPLVVSSVFTTNIGSAATVLGNPIGILIALRADLGFEDFLLRALPVSVVVLAVTIFLLCLWYSSYIKEISSKLALRNMTASFTKSNPIDTGVIVNLAIFCVLILSLGLHRRFELLFGLKENRLLVVLPVIFAGIAVIFRCEQAHYCITHEVEWKSLLFFMFLFAQAGIIQASGLAQLLAEGLLQSVGSHPKVLSALILSSSGSLSGVLDNTVVVSSFVPVVKNLHLLHFSLKPLWWCLLFGACFGGNLTAIGSTANIVAIGVLEKQRNIRVNFLEWLKIGAVISLITLAIAYICISLLPFFNK